MKEITMILVATVLVSANKPKEAPSCNLGAETASEDVQGEFRGTIIYSTSASGEKEGAKMFNDYQADEIISIWGDDGFEQREDKGMNAGKIFYTYDETKGKYLKKTDRKIISASVQDLDKTDPEVKKFIPKMFSYKIENLNEKKTIAGYECTKYKIIESGFLKAGASGTAWITKDLKLRSSQLKFETEWKLILSALPLQFGFKEGAIMKLEISEKSMFGEGTVDVTYEVQEVKEGVFPSDFLQIPEGYTAE